MSAEITADSTGEIQVSIPKPLFSLPVEASGRVDTFEVSRDAQRFLFAVLPEQRKPDEIIVLLNWPHAAK